MNQTAPPQNLPPVDLVNLQRTALQNVLIGGLGATFLLLVEYAYHNAYRLNLLSPWLIAALVMGLTTWLAYRYHQGDDIDRASQLFLVGSILTIHPLLLLPEAPESAYPYLFLVIVSVAGVLIMPHAALIAAGVMAVSSFLTVSLFGDGRLAWLVAPNLLSLLVAVITWMGANNLIVAYRWATRSRQKAKERGDELFESEQQLTSTNRLLETANFRLEQSQRELQKTHAELELLVEDLRQLNASKDRFFSIVAHDLRGPFMPLLGTTELLAEMGDMFSPQEVKELASSVNRSAKNVYQLLENLLQWARMQMGRLDYQPQTIDLADLVAQNIKLLTETAHSKQITLKGQVEPATLGYADENMIDTVIRNLTANALKFTPAEGCITIGAGIKATPATGDTKMIEVFVADTGVGMSEEDMAKLFKLEVRHTTLGTAQEKGTGLGLIICREMVEKNGGTIWVESELGEGTVFKFTLPVAPDVQPLLSR